MVPPLECIFIAIIVGNLTVLQQDSMLEYYVITKNFTQTIVTTAEPLLKVIKSHTVETKPS